MSSQKGFINVLQEFSIPLIAGVVAAVVFANVDEHGYHDFIHIGPFDAICAGAEHDSAVCIDPHHHGGHGDDHHGDDHHGNEHHGDEHHGDEHAADDHGDDHADDDHADDGHADDGHADDGHADDGHADEHHDDATAAHERPGQVKRVFALFGHHLTLHFLINDIFMLFFFGVAAKEITESILPGGALNPPAKAINPLFATIGGVLGPVGMYFLLTAVLYSGADEVTRAAVFNGWGIPTATDIALAWLVARIVFGASHPAVNFLLLLAIADDAIGLGIIAIFYPNPDHPPAPIYLLLVLAGMAVAYFLRKRGTRSWIPYIALGGTLSWLGLINAALHPALALVPIVPFLPGPDRDTGMFEEESAEDYAKHDHSPLEDFEHQIKLFVDFGLFFFGLMNAGVALSSVSNVTWIVLASLLIGKTAGIALCAAIGNMLGFKYPDGMNMKHVLVAGMVAGIGLTVALFVAGEAFPGESPHQGPAKMGALLSALAAFVAIAMGKMFNVKELDK